MVVVVVTTRAIRCAKLQSKCHQQQKQTPGFLQAGCPSCHPTNSVKVLKGNGSKKEVKRNKYKKTDLQIHVIKLHFKCRLSRLPSNQYMWKHGDEDVFCYRTAIG